MSSTKNGREAELEDSLDVSQSTFMLLPLEETRNPTDAREVLHATVQQLDALLHGKDLASQLSSTINLACSSLREVSICLLQESGVN